MSGSICAVDIPIGGRDGGGMMQRQYVFSLGLSWGAFGGGAKGSGSRGGNRFQK